jgi:hypothetical protein
VLLIPLLHDFGRISNSSKLEKKGLLGLSGYIFALAWQHLHVRQYGRDYAMWTFGWFHIKIPKEFGGACLVCVLDVIFLGSTNMEVCF